MTLSLRTLRRPLIAWLLFSLTACTVSASKPQADLHREVTGRLRAKSQPAILFVGNSYSFGVPAALKSLAADHGKTIRTGHSTNSGWTLALHAKNDATLRKIRSGHWDIVVIQEYSQLPAMPFWWRGYTTTGPLRRLVKETRDAGAIPVLYQTWGRRDGDQTHRFLYPRDSFVKMTARLRRGYHAASASCGGIFIVPVGDFWEKKIITGEGSTLFMPDGSHPTADGNQLTAKAFYDAFFR